MSWVTKTLDAIPGERTGADVIRVLTEARDRGLLEYGDAYFAVMCTRDQDAVIAFTTNELGPEPNPDGLPPLS